MTDKNILLHYLLHQYVPNINSYEYYLKSKTKFIFNPFPNGETHIDFINEYFVNSFLYKNKFEVLQELNSNNFVTSEKKEILLHFFCMSQRTFYKFNNLYKIYKQKKYTIYDNDNDLCLSPLSNYKNNIQLIQQNTIYSFKINDLIRLIIEGLTYRYVLFLEPKQAKNPYNNIVFEYHNLYNIYFHILFHTNINVPMLLHAYFKSNFCISTLVYNHEAYLKDLAIKNYIENDDDDEEDERIDHITNMVENYKTHIYIHPNFPNDEIVKNLKHCLLDFLYAEYSYNPTKRRKHKKYLINKLKDFKQNNPRFGRIFVRVNRNSDINNGVNNYEYTTTNSTYNSTYNTIRHQQHHPRRRPQHDPQHRPQRDPYHHRR